MRKLALFVFGFLSVIVSFAQLPQADFSLPENVCIGENIFLQNNSTNANSFSWDFCQGELSSVPQSSNIGKLNGSTSFRDIEVFQEDSSYYAFMLSSNNFLRVKFDKNIDLIQEVIDIKNEVNISNPESIAHFTFNGNFYAFVTSFNSEIHRLDFGTSLLNTPTVMALSLPVTVLPRQVDVVVEENKVFLFATNKKKIAKIVFTDSIDAIPSISEFNIPSSTSTIGLSLVNKEDKRVLFVTDFDKKLYILDFQNSYDNTPTISSKEVSSTYSPAFIDFSYDNKLYNGFLATRTGHVYYVSLDNDLTGEPVIQNYGNFNNLDRLLGIKLFKDNSQWRTLIT